MFLRLWDLVALQNQDSRESENRTYWLSRNQNILDRLLEERSSIICLQVNGNVFCGLIIGVRMPFWSLSLFFPFFFFLKYFVELFL